MWNYIFLILHCMNGTYLYIGHFHNPSELQRHFIRYSDFNKLTKPLRILLTIETVRQPSSYFYWLPVLWSSLHEASLSLIQSLILEQSSEEILSLRNQPKKWLCVFINYYWSKLWSATRGLGNALQWHNSLFKITK